MIRTWNKSIGLRAGRLLAGGVLALAITTAASAHEERYVYEAFVNNKYEPTYPGGEGDHRLGDTPQTVRVEGAIASADSTHGGTVYARAFLPGIDPLSNHNVEYAQAQGFLSYNFWVDGPDPDALVPVRFQAAGTVFASNFLATGGLLLRLSEVGTAGLFQQWSDEGQGDESSGLPVAAITVDQIFFLKPSLTYSIEMSASAGAQAATFLGAMATATLDPVFTIQGDYALNYRMMGVPGGGVVTPPGGGAVPEPATWAMMVAGFGVLGASLRRRGASTRCAAWARPGDRAIPG